MADKFLEILGIAAVGGIVYMVLENNTPLLKRAVSNIHSTISNISSNLNITPVSTTEPVSTTAPRKPVSPSRCPPGMYLDHTMGILSCVDAHGTREVDPDVKLLNQQWQNAFGYDFDNSYDFDDMWGNRSWAANSPPLIPTPSQTLAPPAPVPQTLTGYNTCAIIVSKSTISFTIRGCTTPPLTLSSIISKFVIFVCNMMGKGRSS